MGVVISAVVTFWVGYLIYKKFKPQPVLFMGGMILMWLASILGYGQILGARQPLVPYSWMPLSSSAQP